MRSSLVFFALTALFLTACVSSPVPLAGGQVIRDRVCQWQHLELQLVVDQRSEHLKGTAKLHVRALTSDTRSIPVDLGLLRLAGPPKDSSGRELARAQDGAWDLHAPLKRGEDEVLEIRFDATEGPDLRFGVSPDGDWIRMERGGFFPRVAGRGHRPTMDVILYAGGDRVVVGPGQRLPGTETGVGPAPAHFRLADPMDPDSVNYLVGPMGAVQLSSSDAGWCTDTARQNLPIWSQAWMWARSSDADPGAPRTVVFLPESYGLVGWQGGWTVVPMGTTVGVDGARSRCRKQIIEGTILAGALPDGAGGRDLLRQLVVQAQVAEGLQSRYLAEPNRMQLGLQAMERELGGEVYSQLRTEFLEFYRGVPFGVWEWARFAEHRAGLSAPALFETLTGR